MSNYAKALKHVALRGRASVGLSAAEHEMKLYKRSFLPPDYAPPKLDKWDDMMERWTHAWQHPIADNIETPSREVVRDYRKNILELADFLRIVADNPPFLKTSDDKCLPLLPKKMPQQQLEDMTIKEQNAVELSEKEEYSEKTENREKAENFREAEKSEETEKPYLELVPGEPIVENDIPIAYIDVMAPITVYAKELAIHLADAGLSFDEDGLKTAIRALGLVGCQSDAVFLFDFGRALGLAGRSIVAYNALAATHIGSGSAQAVMDIIEKAKANGITPNVVTWNILINRMSSAGDSQGAIQVFSHMKALANIEPNEEVVTSMLWVYANEGSDESVQKCLELFEQMQTTLEMIPLRQSYTAVLYAMRYRKSRTTELLETAKKMELIGYRWTPLVYECLMANHACSGNLSEIRKLHAQMRENGIVMSAGHLYPVLEALRHQDDKSAKSVSVFWKAHLSTGWGVLRLIQKRAAAQLFESKYQRAVEVGFDGLLRLYETVVGKVQKKYPGELMKVDSLKKEVVTLYEKGPFEDSVTKWDRRCHVNYMKVLAHFSEERARVTSLFQHVLQNCQSQQMRQSKETLYRACVVMIKMHLRSGEEGGTRKALEYIELMENHAIFPTRRLMRQIREIADEAAYTRDMKRRGRRMQQAREEHLADEDSTENPPPPPPEDDEAHTAFDPLHPLAPQDVSSLKDFMAKNENSRNAEKAMAVAQKSADDPDNLPAVVPVESLDSTPASFWERWTKNTISKHDLFTENGPDAMPRGETFSEKNAALQKLGVTSPFVTKDDIPKPAESTLLHKLRTEGSEPTGALWAIDGSGYSYPASRTGSFGWDATLWQERQLVKKAYENAISSSQLSWLRNIPMSLPNTLRKTVPEQMELEATGAKSEAEVSDVRAFPLERYDDGGVEPASEHASPVDAADAYAWEKEKGHSLVPYMSENEITREMGYDDAIAQIADTDILSVQRRQQAMDATRRTIDTLKKAPTDVIAYGATHGMGEQKVCGYKNRKYDYLLRFKDMYQRGQLEVPEEPVVRFGRSEEDLSASTAASVEAFYAATKLSEERGEGHVVEPRTEERVEAHRQRLRRSEQRSRMLRKKGVDTRKLQSPMGKVEPKG